MHTHTNKDASLRVVVAAEDPDVREQIVQMVQREPGVNVIALAENATKAITLTRTLRPEVTVVDSQLPYYSGLDDVRLSRISGLDTAMTILHEIPASRTILLSNTKSAFLQGHRMGATTELVSCTSGACVPIELRKLARESEASERMVFGDVWLTEATLSRSKAVDISDTMIGVGGLAVAGGMVLIIMMFTAIAGAALASVGIVTILMGMVIRTAASWWNRALPYQEDKTE